MTTDRELLEKAAKAADRIFHWDGDVLVLDAIDPGEECSSWNPLVDDGDALRLVVRLGLLVDVDGNSTDAGPGALSYYREIHDGDACAATRRAIVAAAASLAKED